MGERAILMCRRSARGLAHVPVRKFQTRRLVTWWDTLIDGKRSRRLFAELDLNAAWMDRNGRRLFASCRDRPDRVVELAPIWQPGDRLWVQETWKRMPGGTIGYAASPDETCRAGPFALIANWKPSIHMSRADSRFTLPLVEVRPERLQDISEADAIAEGLTVDACEEVFRSAMGRTQWKFGRWLRADSACADYCVDCVDKAAAASGLEVDGWDDHHDSDSPSRCETCGALLCHSLTEYGVDRELWLECDNPDDRPRWPVRGQDAAILQNLAAGIGGLQEGHHGRLAQIAYATWWDELNAARGCAWETNPWVWVLRWEEVVTR